MHTDRRARARQAVVGVALLVLATACGTPQAPSAGSHTVNPCSTGGGIDCDAALGHIATPPTASANGKLVLFFNGTGAQPLGYTKLLGTLADAGYHTIGLRYASGTGTGTACPDTVAISDPDCHRAFRAETVFGEGVADPTGAALDSPAISVTSANSVVNRVLRLVDYLRTTYPSEGWAQFQKRNGANCTHVDATYGVCDLDWSKVVLEGHSLGTGVALYLSKFHAVDRVAMISGPFDEFRVGSDLVVAPWITHGGFATGPARMFGLTHTGEDNYAAQSQAWDSLGMSGPQVSVDSGSAPWGGTHQLTTSVTPVCLVDPVARHNSTAQNLCTPGDPPVLAPAWRYLAGG
jgi:hypothetical protein